MEEDVVGGMIFELDSSYSLQYFSEPEGEFNRNSYKYNTSYHLLRHLSWAKLSDEWFTLVVNMKSRLQ